MYDMRDVGLIGIIVSIDPRPPLRFLVYMYTRFLIFNKDCVCVCVCVCVKQRCGVIKSKGTRLDRYGGLA